MPTKKGSTTRGWERLIDRAHSINESYDMLIRILSEPHRDRAMLVTSVSRRLNAEILMFLDRLASYFKYCSSIPNQQSIFRCLHTTKRFNLPNRAVAIIL